MRARILVATHQPVSFPEDELYAPLHLGRKLSEESSGLPGDYLGENISDRNDRYCELTGLYWAWKNGFFEQSEYCGLVHYRRYFAGSLAFFGHSILSEAELLNIMQDVDLILPRKRMYYVETVRSHYKNAHNIADLETLREVLELQSPGDLQAFDRLMRQRGLYLFNMFVMRTSLFEQYCTWLFPLLFELERRIDVSGYSSYQRRAVAFLSERLFNVWLMQRDLSYREVGVLHLDGENYFSKAVDLFKRRISSR